jgi:hypothetical protein
MPFRRPSTHETRDAGISQTLDESRTKQKPTFVRGPATIHRPSHITEHATRSTRESDDVEV